MPSARTVPAGTLIETQSQHFGEQEIKTSQVPPPQALPNYQSDSLMTSQSTTKNLHLDRIVGCDARSWFVQSQDWPRRVAQLIMLEFRRKEG